MGGNIAARNISATVTYRAIKTTYAAILTCPGTIFLMADTVIFAHNRTNNVARPIAMPFITELVTARAGHVPRTSLKGGISCQSPFLNSCQRLKSLSDFLAEPSAIFKATDNALLLN